MDYVVHGAGVCMARRGGSGMRVEQRAFLLALGNPFVILAYNCCTHSLSWNVNEQVKGQIDIKCQSKS